VINDDMPKVDEKIDLIEEFIKNSPKIKINNDYDVKSSFKTDQKIKDELITETLAKIYCETRKVQ
jgi:hypothetical protein